MRVRLEVDFETSFSNMASGRSPFEVRDMINFHPWTLIISGICSFLCSIRVQEDVIKARPNFLSLFSQKDSNQRNITSTEIIPSNVRRRSIQPEVDRSTRRRLNFDPASVERCKFEVYLPNRTSLQIQLDFDVCQDLTVQRFVALVREEHAKCGCNDAKVKEKQRQIQWGSHVNIEDFEGNILEDGGLASTEECPRVLLLQVFNLG